MGAGVARRADHASAAVGEGAGCRAGVRQLLGLRGEHDAGDEGCRAAPQQWHRVRAHPDAPDSAQCSRRQPRGVGGGAPGGAWPPWASSILQARFPSASGFRKRMGLCRVASHNHRLTAIALASRSRWTAAAFGRGSHTAVRPAVRALTFY